MSSNQRRREAREHFVGPFTARVHNLRNSNSFRRLETAARCNPLTSLFIGTFLTASAVPVTTFLAVLAGTFIFGLIFLVAFQGGVLLFSTVILFACLVTPFFLSAMLAMTAYLALKILKRFHLYEPLSASVPVECFIQLRPVEILENVASRIRAITSTESISANLCNRAIPASAHSTSYPGRENADKECILNREEDEEETSDDARYGSELSECAERQLRQRGLSTEAMEHAVSHSVLRKPRSNASFLSQMKRSHLTLAVNTSIGENHGQNTGNNEDVD